MLISETEKSPSGSRPFSKKIWLAMIVPPILLMALSFLILGIGFYIESNKQLNPQVVEQSVFKLLPYVLMFNHTLLFCFLLWLLRKDGLTLNSIGWQLAPAGKVGPAIIKGLILGVAVHITDLLLFSPLTHQIVSFLRIPDIGNSEQDVHTGFIAWLIAATVFAGVVEESFYRGYGMTMLLRRYRPIWAIIISTR